MIALSILRAANAQNQVTCPWLSTGSAVATLGGDVEVSAHSQNNWDGACRFEHHAEGRASAIEIRVSKVKSFSCPSNSEKIPALGNEAAQCRRALDGKEAYAIAGRVRDAWFEVAIVGIADAIRKLPESADPNRSSMLERLAEQVAGNLF